MSRSSGSCIGFPELLFSEETLASTQCYSAGGVNEKNRKWVQPYSLLMTDEPGNTQEDGPDAQVEGSLGLREADGDINSDSTSFV